MMNISKSMVSAPQPEAVEAAVDILRAGGNAFDAAIACAFVQGVVDPMMTGIAGFGSMAALSRTLGVHEYIDFHAPTPAAAREDMWADLIVGEARDGFGFITKGNVNDIGYQSICVPAALRAYEKAHRKFGMLPWRDVMAPAIEWAKSGYVVRPHVESFWSDEGTMGRVSNQERLRYTAAGKGLFCREDGSPKRIGDTIHNPDLAATLEEIARNGADAFYKGDIAAQIDADMRANGGLVSREDLANYEAPTHAPLWGDYRGYRVSTNVPPGGGIMLVQMMNVLENFNLRAMGHNAAEYIRTVCEAMKVATADKDRYIGDPKFLDVPLDRLLSKDYAAQIATDISEGKKATVPRFNSGFPSKDTTHLSVVDRDGNCVSMTHSLGMPSGVVTKGLGFMYNGCMGVFDPRPGNTGSIKPGKARFSSMCPSIIFKGDDPYIVIGAPGATQIAMGVLQAVLNVLDFDMKASDAVAAPRFSATSDLIDVTNRIPRHETRKLEEMGYQVERSPKTYGVALVHGIRIVDGNPDGGADPGSDGIVLSAA
ncbi:gamma-glutamyltransferase [Phyllobacterium chamaecytisi]|uniref:gamma-glutamyltransferase n=1 Tax=Phyllobacterium chamaecytisi TaxID=2876082 RepID=UPI001CCF35FA|nr:gamma-glutamyltransferase [Phyllobacterium sp. KW56]MBZ9605564.1 gamma-glutamyltransferase [Phyllobacterium sp. KW56]